MEWQSFQRSRWPDHSARSMQISIALYLLCDNLNVVRHKKGNTHLAILLGGPSYEKVRRYNNSPTYIMARWQPQQSPL